MSFSVEKYLIYLDLSGRSDDFPGVVTMEGVGSPGAVELDAKGMQIGSISVNRSEVDFSHDTDEWKVHFSSTASGKASIRVVFTGKILHALHGLYHAGSGDREMLSTDFEPNSARDMIPCFDAPNRKAVFSLKVKIRSELEAISNMPVKEEKSGTPFKEVEFYDTPKMATYLLYLGVGRFSKRSKKHGNVEVILAAPGGSLESDDYPIDTAIKCLEFFDTYFGIKYALPKMHLIAVPEFAAGAMENWGAITFREDSLLTNESTDAASRMWIASTIVHEIAHQWFGDLVTMKWWNDLWLNESFATFMSYLNLDSIYPEYEIWKTFYRSESMWAMNEDSLKSSHPIDVKVNRPEEIQQIFDGVSYGKGGSFLRMMERFVGREEFRSGTSKYLKDYSFSNAEGRDFWEHIERASGQPVVRITREWIKNQGFPAVYVRSGNGNLTLHQERFLLDGTKTTDFWPIPIVVKRRGSEERILMEEGEVVIPEKDFVKVNSDGSGFFITRYEESYYASLRGVLAGFSDIDRAEIINDSYFFLLRGELTLETYFTILDTITEKPFLPTVDIATMQLEWLLEIVPDNKMLVDRAVSFLKRMDTLFGLKTPREKAAVTVARSAVRALLSKFDEDFARKISPGLENYFSLDTEERQSVAYARSHFVVNSDIYVKLVKEATQDEDRNKLIRGMAWVKGNENHVRLLEMIKNGEIKRQDSITAFREMVRNPDFRGLLLEKLEEIISLIRRFFEGSSYASTSLQGAIPLLGLDRNAEIKEIIKRLEGPDVVAGISKGLETLQIYQKFRNEYAG